MQVGVWISGGKGFYLNRSSKRVREFSAENSLSPRLVSLRRPFYKTIQIYALKGKRREVGLLKL